jgi:hypothetical protein
MLKWGVAMGSTGNGILEGRLRWWRWIVGEVLTRARRLVAVRPFAELVDVIQRQISRVSGRRRSDRVFLSLKAEWNFDGAGTSEQ